MEIINLMRRRKLFSDDKDNEDPFPDITNNIRFQLALYEIKAFFRNHQISQSKEIKKSIYTNLRLVKSLCVLIYALLIFFEKPFHCYQSTTFYSVKDKSDNTCNKELEMMDIPHLNNVIHRILEIILMTSFVAIQLVFASERRVLGTYSKNYKYLQWSLYAFISISVIEVFISLIMGFYPLLNHFIRGIILILLVRNLRLVWVNIIYLLMDTINIFFFLLSNLFWFGLVGYTLFHWSEDFSNPLVSMYSLFILLATCNFPDVMLGTFTQDNKSSMIFFVVYIIINYFIIISLLKSLYYSSYFEVYKVRTRKIIKFLKEKQEDPLYQQEQFQKLIQRIKKDYYLTPDEYNSLTDLIGLRDIEFINPQLEQFNNINLFETKFILLLRKKQNEIILTLSDVIFIIVIFSNFAFVSITLNVFQIIWCFLFFAEFLVCVFTHGFKKLITYDLLRFLFLIVNICNLIVLISGTVLTIRGVDLIKYPTNELYHFVQVCQSLMLLRAIRILSMLNNFNEFRTIFITLHNMKRIFLGLTSCLFSLFVVFSSFSMFLTGGKITKDAFKQMKDIPSNYSYVNFNDYGSSFVSCFCLMMVNNLHIIAKSLSYQCNALYQGYFALFYFMATLIILNIIQTLLLEMYLTIKANKIE